MLYNSPFLPRSHARTLWLAVASIMDLKQLSNAIFHTGQIAPRSCSQCAMERTLCVVSLFSNSCGMCLRSARCCSFISSAVPAWMSPDVASSTDELRSDLRRAIVAISRISASLDASVYSSGPLCTQILESYLGSTGSLPPPKNLRLDTPAISLGILSYCPC